MVCGTADILMKFLSLDWFGLGYDCFCKRLHARKLIGKASPKEATTRGFLALDLFAMLGVEVLVCLIMGWRGCDSSPHRSRSQMRAAFLVARSSTIPF